MAGYTRQSTFADGDTITAALFNNEYNQLLNAFSNTSGHKHDGTANEGPVIALIGDTGVATPLNKVLIDTTNDHIEFWIDVSSTSVQQLYIADGAIIPVTDSDIDLGTISLRFKDTYTDTVTTTGNVSIGGDLTVTGSATISGNLTFGDADTDSINLAAEIDSNIVPNTDNTYDLGTATKEWRNLYIDGTANIDSLVADTADINGGTIDGATIATSDITVGAGKTLDVSSGTLTLADDQISGDKVEGGTIAATTITSLTATSADINGGTIDGSTIATSDITVGTGKTLDVSSGTLTLADNQISGDKVEGGTIAATTITDLTFGSLNDGIITVTAFADEDDMSSNSATLIPTQQSVKAYVDSQVTAQDLDFQGDTGGALSIDLDSESLTIAGGTGIDTSGATNTLTVAIDSTVATLTGTQTLTNKTLTTPVISSISNTGTLTLPTSTDTLVGRATTDTLTNKTLTSATLTSPVINTGVSGTAFLDDDTFATATASTLASSESIKAYVDTTVAATNEVVEDTTPQLGGDLDLNSNDITGTGNINITGTIQSSGNITGTLATAAQPNITSVGTLTALDVTGTATMDGAKVETSTTSTVTISESTGSGTAELRFVATDSFPKTKIVTDVSAGSLSLETLGNDRLKIANNGDISFYEDTGTTAKFFWDASAESLGIGTTSPSSYQANADDLVVATTGHTGITIASGTSHLGNIHFADGTSGDDAYRGFIQYDHPSNYMRFATNASEAMRIDSSGKVGIGTSVTNSGRPLHLHTASSGAAFQQFTNTTTGTAGGNGLLVGISSTEDALIYNQENTNMVFATNDTERMRIDSSGNVGIGTDSPNNQSRLSLNLPSGTNGRILTMGRSAGAYAYHLGVDASSRFTLYNNDGTSSLMAVDSSGNVGIGTSSPSSVLEVAGTGDADTGILTTHSRSGVGYTLRLNNTNNGANKGSGIKWSSGGFDTGAIIVRSDATAASGDAPAYMTFHTSADGTEGVNERMRIDSSGNLLVGKTSTSTTSVGSQMRPDGFISGFRASDAPALFARGTDDGDVVVFRKNSSTIGRIGTAGGDVFIGGDTHLRFTTSDVRPCDSNGDNQDNFTDLGDSVARFDDIYATNGTIQTSDRNEKQDIEALTDAETRVAVAAKGLLRKFRWQSAVEEKGDEARTHFGIIAQDLQDAFTAEGLDAGDYAMFISSTWTNDDGVEQTRLGVRYSELLAFIIAAI